VSNRSSIHFDAKLDAILRQAAAVFCARGYHRASIRDIARATGVSLAGLYYYFSSKSELLFLIQQHAFETIVARARAALESQANPEDRLRTFMQVHLKFFTEHPNEMKVLTHEEKSLEDERRRELHALKKDYYRLCYEQVEEIKQRRKLKDLNTRLAVLSLFGMMNWIYTWYNPRVDPDAPTLAREMSDIFLEGILSAGERCAGRNGFSRRATRTNGFRRGTRAVAQVAPQGPARPRI